MATSDEKITHALKLRRKHEELVKNRASLGDEAIAKVGTAAGAWIDAENALDSAEYDRYMIQWRAGVDPR
jgi:hypothetical protein